MATIQHKRSSTSGVTPLATELADGEIAVNTADGKLFTKHGTSVVTLNATAAQGTAADNALPTSGGTMTGNLKLNDNIELQVGSGSPDFRMRHNGSATQLQNYTGQLQLTNFADDTDIRILTDDGSGGTTDYFRADGSTGDAILYHSGSEKLKTQSGGVTVTGTVTADGLSLGDSEIATFGASNDLTIQHSTTHGNIIGGNAGATRISLAQPGGYLSIDNGVFDSGFKSGALFDPDGSQILRYAGFNTLETQSTGVKVTGNVTVTDKIEHDGDTDTYIQFTDNKIGFTAGGVEKLAINNINSPYNVNIDANAFINADYGLNANSQSGGQSFNIFGSSFFGSNIIDSPAGYDILINCPYDKRFRVHKGGYYQSGVPILQSSSGTTTDIGLYYGGSLKLITVSGGVNVTGNLTATGDVTAFSDARLKENVETIDNALEKVCGLRGVSYEKDGKKGIGVIAQEVEEVVPEVVGTHDDKDATRTVAYGNMVGVLIEAIKEQQQQIENLKAKVTELGGYE